MLSSKKASIINTTIPKRGKWQHNSCSELRREVAALEKLNVELWLEKLCIPSERLLLVQARARGSNVQCLVHISVEVAECCLWREGEGKKREDEREIVGKRG